MGDGLADKYTLIRQSREALEQRKKLLDRITRLQAEYDRLCEDYQPTIESLSREADELAGQFKSMYENSHSAFEDGDRAMAKVYSVMGHDLQGKCQDLNTQANELRHDLATRLATLKSLRAKAANLQVRAEHDRQLAFQVRKTSVRGFDSTAVMTDDDVEGFLDRLPQVIFHKVYSVAYVGAVYGDGKYDDVEALGRGDWGADGKLRIEIGAKGATTKEQLKLAISHELGHVVYQYFISQDQRADWFAYHAETEPANFVTLEALQDEEEDFAECFALFVCRPKELRAKDKTKYGFLKKIYDELLERS